MRAERRARRGRARLALLGLLLGGSPLAVAPGSAPARTPDEPPVLAVLGFRVHSARPIGYLGESLAGLMRSRLEAGGELRVVDAARVAQELATGGGDTSTDSGLRELARALGAEHVVTGSLTELAGRYSLDVRVTPAAVGLRPHSLVATAANDDDLLARVNELADGVAKRVLGAAAARVARVEILGLPDSEDEVREKLATRAGEPFDPAVLRDDLAVLRRDPGLASARVETERGPEGVVVRFRLVAAEQVFSAPTPGRAAERVAEVRLRGNRRIEADAIRARLATRPGEPYRTGVIARDVKAIYELGFFRDVRVFTESGPRGRIVTFEVEETPVVRQISISGNESIDGDKIRDILTLTTGSSLDNPLLFENRGRIEALYRAEGFYLADVDYEIEPLNEASVGVHFIVDEKEKLRLKKIVFTGNEYFSDGELREEFDTKTWHFWSYATSWFDRSGTYSEPLFLQDLRKVQKRYTDAGFLQVEVGEPDVTPVKGGLTVTVPIMEGVRYRCGSLDVAGDSTVDIETVRDKLSLEEGEYFNRSHLTDDVATITRYYTDRGFYFASVTPLTNLSEKTQEVDVVFQVRKGPLYFVRQIDISGNTTTVDSVIRREVPIVEGQLYSQRQVQLSRARIERLGFFEEVDLAMEPTDEPDQLDLHVSVVERPTGSLSFGAGFSSQDSFVFTGSLSQSNLFGRGYAARLSADIGGRTQRFFLSFQDPAAFGTTFSVGTTIFRTTMRFEDFEQEQMGFDLSVGHALSEDNRSRGFLRYSFASRKLNEDPEVNAAAAILREIFQDSLTSSLVGFAFQTDRRDDRLAPTEGYEYAGALEYSGLGFFSKFARVEGRAAWFLGAPRWMPERSTFVLSSRFGWTIPFNDVTDFETPELVAFQRLPGGLPSGFGDQIRLLEDVDSDTKLPLSERYFLGGLGQFQLRGFRARSVGPRRPILTAAAITSPGNLFRPVGTTDTTGACTDSFAGDNQGNGNGKCNDIDDEKLDDFEDLEETDVIGGNKFISSSVEYRFPISDTIGLQGVFFLDFGNAFAEGDNLFDVSEWRYGTGVGVQWFSPFGPLALVLGFPLDREAAIEDSPVFEFSVGGQGF